MRTIVLEVTNKYTKPSFLLTDKGKRDMRDVYNTIGPMIKGRTLVMSSDQPRAQQAATMLGGADELTHHKQLCGRKPEDTPWFVYHLRKKEKDFTSSKTYAWSGWKTTTSSWTTVSTS